MKKTRKARPILVAVRATDNSARAILRKAAALAKLHGAPLRIVHVLALPPGALDRAGASVKQAAQEDLESRSRQLLKLADLPVLRGLEVSTSVRCDYPVADALVREVLEHRPQMLLAESHRHGRFARLWLSNTDWELIRNCPCPLWLCKSGRFDTRATVMAAVDPLHAHAKPAALDDLIVANALKVAGGRRKQVVLCHSYDLPESVVVDTPIEAYWIAMPEEERQAYVAKLKRAIGRLLERQDIPAENAAIVRGDPTVQLPRLAKKHAASVVVMGAVSRRGLQRVFIGNTAERVIDQLSCDVLIVKPRGFRSPVSRAVRHPRTRSARGHSLAGRRQNFGGRIVYLAPRSA